MNHSLQESKHLHTHTHTHAVAHKYLGNQNLLSVVARLAAPLSTKRRYRGCAQSARSAKGLTTPG